MKKLNTDFYNRCILRLQLGMDSLNESEDLARDLYRSACIKEFEIILEQSGKLLKKCLKAYFATSKEVDALTFNDVFRHSGRVSLLTLDQVDRWLVYRRLRNTTAHDYGEEFAEEMIAQLPQFMNDAKNLEKIISDCFNKGD